MNQNPTTEKPAIILASSSRYRGELLARIVPDFTQQSPDIDESPHDQETPKSLSIRLATEKAQAVARSQPDKLVIGSDQVLAIGAHTLGKPGTLDKARKQLEQASGQSCCFHTAVCVVRGEQSHAVWVPTTVVFRQLDDDEINRYLQREPALDCAGSFKSEALGISLCQSIHSDDATALIGLPLIATCNLLRKFGLQLP